MGYLDIPGMGIKLKWSEMEDKNKWGEKGGKAQP